MNELSSSDTHTATSSSGGVWAWRIGLFVLGVLLLGIVLAVGWRGYTEGVALRDERQRQAAAIYLSRAEALASVGELDQAEQELIEALRLAPDYPAAQERLSQLHQQAVPTPTLVGATATPTPTTQPSATPTPTLNERLTVAQHAIDGGSWGEAITILENIRSADPGFAKDTVQTMLVQAYIAEGLGAVDQDQLDQAIQRFDAALVLDPNNLEATEQRDLALAYREAIREWDQNWQSVTTKLDILYQRAPNYKDVTGRLALAYTIQGDRQMDARQPCVAEEAYRRSLTVVDQADTQAKLTRARQACLIVRPLAPTPLPARRFNPQLVVIQDSPGPTATIVGRVLDREGRPLRGFEVTAEANGQTRSALSDNLGQFRFEGLPATTYILDIPAGIGPALEVKLESGKQALIEFVEP